MTIFGRSLDSEDVEQAVIAHLDYWLPTYIPEIRRQKDPDAERWPNGVAPIASVARDVTDDAGHRWPEDQLPCVIVSCPGEEEDPTMFGNGRVDAAYGLAILCVAEGYDEDESKALARLYGSAVRMAIMQHPDLGAGGEPFAEGVRMTPERNDAIKRGVDAQRNLAGSLRGFVIGVPEVLQATEGPQEALEDPEDPPEEWPEVKEDGGSVEVEQGASKVELLREGGFFENP